MGGVRVYRPSPDISRALAYTCAMLRNLCPCGTTPHWGDGSLGDCQQSHALVGQRPDLQGEDGLSLLRFLRENHRTAETPVIMLTAKGTEMDKVQGLDYGADDYSEAKKCHHV